MNVVRHWRLISSIAYVLVAAAAAGVSSPAAANWVQPGFYIVWSGGTPDGPYSSQAACETAAAEIAHPGERWECRYLAHNPNAKASAEHAQDQAANRNMPKGSPKNPNSDDRWTSVGSFGVGGDRATVYVNMAEAYKQEDGGWELQIWSTWQSPQSDPKGEYTDAEGHVSLHCSTKEAGASPMEQIYNSTGAQIDSNTDYVPSRAIPPNSIAEVLYDGFCASNGVSN